MRLCVATRKTHRILPSKSKGLRRQPLYLLFLCYGRIFDMYARGRGDVATGKYESRSSHAVGYFLFAMEARKKHDLAPTKTRL